MVNEDKKSGIPWDIFLGVPGSLATLLALIFGFAAWLEPDLTATANGKGWKAPSDVKKELEGMVKVSHLCKSLKGAMDPNLNVAVQDVNDPNLNVVFKDVNDLSRKIIRGVEDIEPCEAKNVESLRTMYTIEVENNGAKESRTILLQIADAKYVQYENHGGQKKPKTGTFRDEECRVVPMGRLQPNGRITAHAWVLVSPNGGFRIKQEDHGDVHLYAETLVGRIQEYVRNLFQSWLVLFFIFLFTVMPCLITYWRTRKALLPKASGEPA